MKATFFAVAAAMAVGCNARGHGHMHKARGDQAAPTPAPPAPPAGNASVCVPTCYTIWQYEFQGTTYTVPSPTSTPVVVVETKSILVVPTPETKPPPPPPAPTSTTTSKTTATTTSTVLPPPPPPPTHTSTAISTVEVPETTAEAVTPPPVSVAAPTTTTEATVITASAVSSPSVSSGSGSSGETVSLSITAGSSGFMAITYTPYVAATGACKTRDEVFADIAIIVNMGFTCLRLYSCDCNGLQNIGDAAKKNGLTLILGVYIDDTGIAGAQSQVTALQAFEHWDIVDLTVVGNEATFNGWCTAEELIEFVATCKAAFTSYTGPLTITEPLDIWQANADVFCPGIDVAGATLHPFFNADITADQAGSFAASQLAIVESLCPGKEARNLECGWPNNGLCNGNACPGVQEQQTAIASIKEACGSKTVLFSMYNDMWKQPGNLNIEQFWGVVDILDASAAQN